MSRLRSYVPVGVSCEIIEIVLVVLAVEVPTTLE